MRTRILAVSVISLAAGMALAGIFARSRREIHIGLLATLTGKGSALGRTCRDGAVLAAEHVNQAGGVNGHGLALEIRDDGNSVEASRAALREFQAIGVQSAIGPTTSKVALGIVPHLDEYGILLIGPVIAAATLAGKRDLFIHPYPTTEDLGHALAAAILKRGARKAVFVLARENPDFSASVAEHARQAVTPTVQINEVWFGPADSPHQLLVTGREIAALSPDTVIFSANSLNVAMLSQILKKQIPAVRLFSTSWGISTETIQSGGAAVDGLEAPLAFRPNDKSETYRRFAMEYQSRFGDEPTFCSVFHYDAVTTLADALRNDHDASASEIRETLENSTHHGLMGDVVLDKNGDGPHRFFMHIIRNHALVEEE